MFYLPSLDDLFVSLVLDFFLEFRFSTLDAKLSGMDLVTLLAAVPLFGEYLRARITLLTK